MRRWDDLGHGVRRIQLGHLLAKRGERLLSLVLLRLAGLLAPTRRRRISGREATRRAAGAPRAATTAALLLLAASRFASIVFLLGVLLRVLLTVLHLEEVETETRPATALRQLLQ